MQTAYDLIARLRTIPIEVLESRESDMAPDGSIGMVLRIPEDDVEKGALSLLFAIGLVSYTEAKPAGASEIHYDAGDQWTVHDLVEHLRFQRSHLVLDTDYVRGRHMKTRADIAPDGTVRLNVTNRGSTAKRWIATLQGRGGMDGQLGVVGEEPGLFFAPTGIDPDPLEWPGVRSDTAEAWASAASEGVIPEDVAEVLAQEPKLADLTFTKGVLGEEIPGRPHWARVAADLTVYAQDELGNKVAMVVVAPSEAPDPTCGEWAGDDPDRQRQVGDLLNDLWADPSQEEVQALSYRMLTQTWAAAQQAADERSTRAVLVVSQRGDGLVHLAQVLGVEGAVPAGQLVMAPEEVDGVTLWLARMPA